jgi:putative inorganic carbon (HCO3(-)) transporter
MLQNKPLLKNILAAVLIAGFILLNGWFYTQRFFLFSAVPAALAIILIAIVRYDYLLYFIVFTTPLSFNFEDLAVGGVGFYFPTEPLLFGLMLLFFLQALRKSPLPIELRKHPISILIFIQLVWLTLTTITSSLPMVSFKFLLSQLWFVTVLFFLVATAFKNKNNIERLIWLYIIPLCGVVIYTIVHHAQFNFSEETGHWVMSPFYKDHTSYGAVLALYYPVILCLFNKGNYTGLKRALILVGITILTAGLVLSYTRAAWVSLVISLGVYLILLLRIKGKVVLGVFATLLTVFIMYQPYIVDYMEKNDQDSSDNMMEHVESITNISSDASNLERLNRWGSAWRMFLDRPLVGFGPGTYQFKYAPFQLGSERTIISTNFGDVGNAHSEYLGPLAETGLIGLLIKLALIISVIALGVKLYKKLENQKDKAIALGLLLGLISYFIHGILNNYLDTDKASVPVWTFIASLVAYQVWHLNSKKKIKE